MPSAGPISEKRGAKVSKGIISSVQNPPLRSDPQGGFQEPGATEL